MSHYDERRAQMSRPNIIMLPPLHTTPVKSMVRHPGGLVSVRVTYREDCQYCGGRLPCTRQGCREGS